MIQYLAEQAKGMGKVEDYSFSVDKLEVDGDKVKATLSTSFKLNGTPYTTVSAVCPC